MIYLKTNDEIAHIKVSCELVSLAIAEVAKNILPGVSTFFLDKIAEDFIRSHDAVPAFKGYRGFPASLCVSLNDEVVHGIPHRERILKDGDVVSIDCGVIKNGFVGDSAYTFSVGEIKPEVEKLLRVTKESLYLGIAEVAVGKRIGDISFVIQENTERKHGYGVVRELVGHGVGKKLHEDPEVPNYGKRGSGVKLQEGMVIAIEPMINLGTKDVRTARDGWTIYTEDRKPSAHFEHTIAIRKEKAEILTTFDPIEEVLRERHSLVV
jgi:methionyl aminopeptidase